MLNKIFQKAMGFLQQPAKAFDAESKTEPMEAFVYMAVLSIVGAVLTGIVSLFSPLGGGFLVMTAILGAYIGGIVFSVISGLWLHLWAYIFGAKKGLNQTLKTVFYGGTPSYLLGWIPFIGILFFLWSLYLEWTGLQRLHGMPGDKAALSIVVAFVIPFVLLIVLAMVALSLLSPFLSQMGGFPPGF
jgi:hypothetical protein